MDKKIIELAAAKIKVSVEDAEKHYKEVPEINGYYFWNPVRGGLSVLINSDGEMLAATSSVSFHRHLEAFLGGKRN